MTELTITACPRVQTFGRQGPRHETLTLTHANPYAAWALLAREMDRLFGTSWVVLTGSVRSVDSAVTPNPTVTSSRDRGASLGLRRW